MRKEVKKGDILKRPEYPGGHKALRSFIAENLRYPKEALEAGLEGTVHIRYTIGHDGLVKEARILHGIGLGCDEEALRLVKLLRFNVEKTRGVRVEYPRKMQIHFRLPVKTIPTTPSSINYHLTPAKPKVGSPSPAPRTFTITIQMD